MNIREYAKTIKIQITITIIILIKVQIIKIIPLTIAILVNEVITAATQIVITLIISI